MSGITLTAGALRPSKPAVFNAHPTTTGALGAANQLRGSFIFLPTPLAFDRARIRVHSGGGTGNISVAGWSADGQTRLFTTGAIATPANGNQDLAITEQIWQPGVYFVGLSADNTTVNFAVNTTAAQVIGGTFVGAGHPAPTTITVDDGSAGSVPIIGLFHS